MKGAIVLIPVARVEHLILAYGERFLGRVFTRDERRDCRGRRDMSERLAARLAAKQAARRCLPDRPRLISIRVETDAAGAPTLRVDPEPNGRLFVSISHDGGVSGAAVFVEPGERIAAEGGGLP